MNTNFTQRQTRFSDGFPPPLVKATLIVENELRVDQSTLSEESHPVRKASEAAAKEHLTHAELPSTCY